MFAFVMIRRIYKVPEGTFAFAIEARLIIDPDGVVMSSDECLHSGTVDLFSNSVSFKYDLSVNLFFVQ